MITRRHVLLGGASATASALVGAGFGPGAARAATSGLAVTFGKADITPGRGAVMAGYGTKNEPRRATGTYMSLFARCTIIWDDGFPNVIVTADVLGFGRAAHQSIRSRVTALGVASADFMLCASHTHNGAAVDEKLDPYISYNANDAAYASIHQYTTDLGDAIVALVRDTLAKPRVACTLDYTVTSQGFSYNRAELSYVETAVPVITARDQSGRAVSVLFGYGCHPVAAGYQTLFDPDYPGEAATWIEDVTNAFAQFIPGPAGDQDPASGRGWALRDALGSSLGHAVIDAIATPGRPITGPIRTSYREVSLPLDITMTRENLDAVAVAYDKRANNPGSLSLWDIRHARAMAPVARRGIVDTVVPLPLQVWKLAGSPGLTIAMTGGEIVSGYAVYFRSRFGGVDSLIFGGYTNEVPCYIPSDEILAKNNTYEGGKWADEPGIAGGSMAVYNWFGHFRGKNLPNSPDGVEQILIAALTSML